MLCASLAVWEAAFYYFRNMSMMRQMPLVIPFCSVVALDSSWQKIYPLPYWLFVWQIDYSTVYLVEVMHSTKLVSEDSAIGIVFPLLFSIAIIAISKYARNTHLDVKAVLCLRYITFAPWLKISITGNLDLGARAIYSSGTVLMINFIFFNSIFSKN